MKSGIYCITNKVNNKRYVGQSVNLERRIARHKGQLKRNKHHNTYLQSSYDKYGEDNFTYEVIERCDVSELDEREVYWIAYYETIDRSKGFNRETGGNQNKSFSEDRIKSITGEGNPMFGRKHSEEYVEWIRNHNRGRSNLLNEDKVKEIKHRYLEGETQTELGKEYGVSKHTIHKIVKCKNWQWVLPELETQLLNYSPKSIPR